MNQGKNTKGMSKKEQGLLLPGLNWIACLVIGFAALIFASGIHLYNAQREEARLIEEADAINNRLVLIGKTYAYIHALGQNREEEARVNLNLALRADLSLLDDALSSTDEDTRTFAKHLVAVIDLDKRRHPGYYAVPIAARPSFLTTNASDPAHNCVPLTNNLASAHP